MEIDKNDLFKTYQEKKPLFQRSLQNTKEALQQFLTEIEIPYLIINTRLKNFDSFYEKISRKGYEKPFEENEDFCGVRIVVYHLDDIVKVKEIIKENYEIQNSEDKTRNLKLNQVGYRSDHLIIKIKNSWCVTPNYKNLSDIKIEIQIRTVLMHAWAEIEHKLGYKSKTQIPEKLQRKLFLMSGKLEEADYQFQEIKYQAEDYKQKTIAESQKAGKFVGKELNLNSLQALLTYYYPNEESHSEMESRLLEEIEEANYSMEEVDRIAKKTKDVAELIKSYLFNDNINRTTTKANILTYGLEAFGENFRPVAASSQFRKKITQQLQKTAPNNGYQQIAGNR
jgi:ppGpp synthetase/RelA/SpoT-type nucleotidyltranferase